MDLVFFVWCRKGGVERVVDFSCLGKAELICDRGEDLDDCEGSFVLGVNFRLVMEHLRFLASSQILSPLEKGVTPWLLREDITCQASSCAARASS